MDLPKPAHRNGKPDLMFAAGRGGGCGNSFCGSAGLSGDDAGAYAAPAQIYGGPAITVAGVRLADCGADVPVCSPGPAAADPVWPLEQALLALSSSKS